MGRERGRGGGREREWEGLPDGRALMIEEVNKLWYEDIEQGI